jgi:hypothetical protein
MRRTTGTVLALATSLVLVSCGGGSSSETTTTKRTATDRERVVATARAYTVALVEGRNAAACALMTPASRAQLASEATAIGATATCPALLEETNGSAPAGGKGADPAVTTSVVTLAGDRARVRTTVEGQSDTIDLQRVGRRWLVDSDL